MNACTITTLYIISDNYFIRSGYYLTGYDAKAISRIIAEEVRKGRRDIGFKCSNAAVLRAVKSRLIDQGGVWDIFRSVGVQGRYYYRVREDVRTIHIILQ